MHKKLKDRLYQEWSPQEEFYKIFQRYSPETLSRFFTSNFFAIDLIHKFGGIQGLQALEKNDEVSSAIEKRKAALLNTKLVIEHDSPEIKSFFEEQILPWENDLKEGFFTAIEYGYGVTQIIYSEDRSCKVDGYQIEDPWNFLPHEDLIHVSQWNKYNEVLPYGKWVVSHYNARASRPQGLGLYEKLLVPYLLKCKANELWDFYLKRFAGGFITAQTEYKDDLEAIRQALDKAEEMGSIVTTSNVDVSSLGFSGDPSSFMHRNEVLAKSIQKVVLGETQTTDISTGSSISARVHNDVRWEKTLFDMQVLKRSFQSLVEQIAFVCGARPDQVPKVNLILDVGMDEERINADTKLFSLGVRFNKKYFENNYNLDPSEFDVVDPSQSAVNSLGGLFNLKASGKKHEFKSNSPDELATYGLETFKLPISEADLLAAIASSEDEKDLEKKLLSLYENTDLEFVENFAAMLYSSAASGALKGIPINKKVEPLSEEEQDEYL